jgi:sugar lactone lactonase YvrE
MMYEVEHVLASQAELGEGPVWHPEEQVLYFLDITKGRLHRFDPLSEQHDVTELGLVVGSMGVRTAGGWVMATRKGFALRGSDGQMTFIGDPDADENEKVRFNDGKTDPTGRFWAGKMSDTPTNCLYRLDPDGSIHRMESGIGVSNGLGWSPDLTIFYYTDSPAKKIYAYDYDPASGTISSRREFASVPEGGGSPDGLAVDVEGCIWSARWGGWKVMRYAPDGEILAEIAMPVELPTSCAFGGPNLDELYITSAYVAVPAERRAEQPLAGDVFRIRPGVRGLPEPKFGG